MAIKQKSFNKILNDLVGEALQKTSVADLNPGSAVNALAKALEVGMYAGCPEHEVGIRGLLEKFNIKSAWEGRSPTWGGTLQIEGLDATLKNVTFDDKHLKNWRKPNAPRKSPSNR